MGEIGEPRRSIVHGRTGSIRVRTTVAAVLVVGVSLVLASITMVVVLEGSLRREVRTAAMLRAQSFANRLGATTSADLVPFGDPGGDVEFVQVLDASGDVVLSSTNVAGLGPLASLRPGETRTIAPISAPDEEPIDEPFLAAAASGPDDQVIIVGRSLEVVTDAKRSLVGVLAIAVPLLLLVVGLVTWRVVGRALSPVDAIRAEVEGISGKELHRRVSEPGGTDEIARLAATMNRMLARLEAGRLRERRFVSDASHELRSPVATIRQHAEVALAHPEQSSTQELAKIVLDEDGRLQRLVEDLLLLTRIDEGTLDLRTEAVDLDDLIFDEAARLRSATDLKIDVGGVSAGRVIGDREQLGRLIRNLTENATRHARRKVVLSLRESNGEVVLEVHDDGEGIGDSDRGRVFDRFVRLDEARDRDSGGSGLGLAIVREVAVFHGGTVSIVDGSLGGTGFEVRLPTPPDPT